MAKVRPPLKVKGKLKKMRMSSALKMRVKKARTKQLFSRFTLVWVNFSGDPYYTAGFYARATTLGGVFLGYAFFDAYGTAIFYGIGTPINQTIRIDVYNSSGVYYRTRYATAGNSAWVIIG